MPPFTILENARAKRILVKFTDREGLVVFIPRGMDRDVITPILEKNRETIEKVINEKQERLRKALAHGELTPSRISFLAIRQTWEVLYKDSPSDSVACREKTGNVVEIEGPKQETRIIVGLLRDWLKEKARQHLRSTMEKEAQRCSLSFNKLQFRIQKTRWGSRSATGTISLNASLLFLEPHLVRHVMIHELCHTIHMNHSPNFWSLVSQFDPHWKSHRKILRQSSSRIPLWVQEIH